MKLVDIKYVNYLICITQSLSKNLEHELVKEMKEKHDAEGNFHSSLLKHLFSI